MSYTRMVLYVGIFIVGFVTIALYNTYLVTHPNTIEVSREPEQFNFSYESVTLHAADETTLSGWHIPSEESPKKVILLLHGYPVEKADLLGVARELHPQFSIFLLDFRYFGESGGSASTLGMKETQDARAALDFLSEQGYEQIGVFGYSYGGTVALLTAAEDKAIDAVATYGAFADLRTLGHDVYKNLWLLKYPFVELMNMSARLAYGEWFSSVSPHTHASAITQPVFIGHSKEDPIIPVHHSEMLSKALEEAGNAPETYFPQNEGHVGIPFDVIDRVRSFFGQHL